MTLPCVFSLIHRSNFFPPISVLLSSRSVKNHEDLVALVGPEGGEVAHIWISDGRFLARKVYSTFPGSESRSEEIKNLLEARCKWLKCCFREEELRTWTKKEALALCRFYWLTLKALWDGERPVIAGGHHRVATPVGLVHAVEGDMLSVKDPVGLQVCDPHLPGVVEDAASLDADGAGGCTRKCSSR